MANKRRRVKDADAVRRTRDEHRPPIEETIDYATPVPDWLKHDSVDDADAVDDWRHLRARRDYARRFQHGSGVWVDRPRLADADGKVIYE